MGRYDYVPEEFSEGLALGELPSVPLALGELVVSFQGLEGQLDVAISYLLGRGDTVGRIVTADLSFNLKLTLFRALFLNERPDSAHLKDLAELCGACAAAEGKRNQMVHSGWHGSLEDHHLTRVKHTARSKLGLQTASEDLSPARAQSVWMHCAFLAYSVDDLMFREFGEAYGQP